MTSLARSDAGREAGERIALVAAYREGLGLTAVAVICGPTGTRVAAVGQADDAVLTADETVQLRWWCRRTAEPERVAAAATAGMRRRHSRDSDATLSATPLPPPAGQEPGAASFACECVIAAARWLNIALLSEKDIAEEAMIVAARIDGEIESMQRSGELKSVNKEYRRYRLEASARGEKVLRYQQWMHQYRINLMRKLAAALRHF